ncbi:Aerotolerance protein BatB / Aerotolerance protein BatC [hydrothermal vent metagenome]|uniref:Aerotolerance protein BatB / Aerotolerance protein BatC n=1 Tax=hydrothermal vent metagenome TaxID=652676 RepID=A0A3B1A8L2_9ZZZZ
MTFAIDWQSLHLLRPWWLLALLPAFWLAWRSWRAQNRSSDWSKVVDAELLPHLLEGEQSTRRRFWPLLMLCGWVIATLAISGPAWQKLPQPLYMQESALVILLDLSRSMDANDLTPSRLTHARLKILDILAQRHEGQTGLVVYTDEAYVVSPLTDDNRTIANLVPALSSEVMPSQGSRLSVAIERANKLLDDAGFQNAQLLVVSDGVNDQRAFDLAQQLATQNRTLSTLAIGNQQGSPIPLSSGGFLKDSDGAIVISKADHASLQRIAALGGGRYTPLRHDGSDLTTLFPEELQPLDHGVESERQQSQQQWHDEGVWLLLPLLILAAFAFRRGWLFSVVFCVLLIQPQTSYALEWDHLWQSRDQQAANTMQLQQFQQAAEQFADPLWQASALYRAGDYQQAAELFSQYNTADSHYNRGNALAKAGQLPEAIAAYQAALEIDPKHQDSQFNLALLQSLMEQQQDQQSDSNQQGDEGEQQAGESQQQGEDGEPQSQPGEQSGEQSEQQPSSSQPSNSEENPNASESSAATEQNESTEEGDDTAQATQQTENKTGDESNAEQAQQAEPQESAQSESDAAAEEQAQYLQQWLRRIPDDPGGLLRRKFEQQHQQQQPQQREEHQPW